MRTTTSTRAGGVLVAGTFAFALALGLGACSDDGGDDGTTETTVAGGTGEDDDGAAAGDATITIEGFAFNDLTVAPGAEVSVTNADSAPHTVTSDADAWEEVRVGGDESGTFTAPAEPGSYAYFCAVHGAGSMSGTLVVE